MKRKKNKIVLLTIITINKVDPYDIKKLLQVFPGVICVNIVEHGEYEEGNK